MKLVVFGATGGTGRCILDVALAAGHDVLALARKPEAIPLRDNLSVEKGDVLDAGDVASAVQGADAVLSAFGPASNKHPGTLMSQGVANIVAGCTKHGVKRFVFESGLMCSDGSELGFIEPARREDLRRHLQRAARRQAQGRAGDPARARSTT